MKELFRRFFDNMAEPPQPGPELIPKRWRMMFFIGLVAVSLVALASVVWFIVIPGIDALQSSMSGSIQSRSLS